MLVLYSGPHPGTMDYGLILILTRFVLILLDWLHIRSLLQKVSVTYKNNINIHSSLNLSETLKGFRHVDSSCLVPILGLRPMFEFKQNDLVRPEKHWYGVTTPLNNIPLETGLSFMTIKYWPCTWKVTNNCSYKRQICLWRIFRFMTNLQHPFVSKNITRSMFGVLNQIDQLSLCLKLFLHTKDTKV